MALGYIACPHQAQLKQNKSKKRGLFKRKIISEYTMTRLKSMKKFLAKCFYFLFKKTLYGYYIYPN